MTIGVYRAVTGREGGWKYHTKQIFSHHAMSHTVSFSIMSFHTTSYYLVSHHTIFILFRIFNIYVFPTAA
jgi:hypothetical protein